MCSCRGIFNIHLSFLHCIAGSVTDSQRQTFITPALPYSVLAVLWGRALLSTLKMQGTIKESHP